LQVRCPSEILKVVCSFVSGMAELKIFPYTRLIQCDDQKIFENLRTDFETQIPEDYGMYCTCQTATGHRFIRIQNANYTWGQIGLQNIVKKNCHFSFDVHKKYTIEKQCLHNQLFH